MKYLYVIFIIVIFCGCKSNNSNSLAIGATFDSISVIPVVDSLLNDFIKDDAKVCSNSDVFLITYTSFEKRIITFISTNQGYAYLKNHNPLICFRKESKKVFVIMGSEVLFNVYTKESYKIDSLAGNHWSSISYVISNDSIVLIPQGIPPFLPPPEDIIELEK